MSGRKKLQSQCSSTDDSEDEATMRMLREATDQTLLTNAMYNEEKPAGSSASSDKPEASTSNSIIPSKCLRLFSLSTFVKQTFLLLGIPRAAASNVTGRKSQRYIEVDERLENDMQVTESMQNFMHKKLNQILETRIEFVEIEAPQTDQPADDSNDGFSLQLFSNSEPIVLSRESIAPVAAEKPTAHHRQKRPKNRKRTLPDEVAISEADKIRAAVVTPDHLQSEVAAWKDRSKPHKLHRYKEHASKTLYLVEPSTEFSAQRKKNNWSEGKIARK